MVKLARISCGIVFRMNRISHQLRDRVQDKQDLANSKPSIWRLTRSGSVRYCPFESVLTLMRRPPRVQVAFVGFAVQALVSRTQPIEGLTAHLADPFGKNITYYLTHLPETLAK